MLNSTTEKICVDLVVQVFLNLVLVFANGLLEFGLPENIDRYPLRNSQVSEFLGSYKSENCRGFIET
jgi:hypothetical protein